jgi:hypothetical protein
VRLQGVENFFKKKLSTPLQNDTNIIDIMKRYEENYKDRKRYISSIYIGVFFMLFLVYVW